MSKLFRNLNEGFICEYCGGKVSPLKYGGHNRNHCPFCLYSKHVDNVVPGDRSSSCRGLMKPVATQTKRTGEYSLIHRCLTCGKISINRVAGDDNWDLICELSTKKNK